MGCLERCWNQGIRCQCRLCPTSIHEGLHAQIPDLGPLNFLLGGKPGDKAQDNQALREMMQYMDLLNTLALAAGVAVAVLDDLFAFVFALGLSASVRQLLV